MMLHRKASSTNATNHLLGELIGGLQRTLQVFQLSRLEVELLLQLLSLLEPLLILVGQRSASLRGIITENTAQE
jgi:hypothetical protein